MSITIACPHCGRTDRQVKAGMNAGSQRYKCVGCGRRYTPVLQPRGYPAETRRQARRLRAQGLTTQEVGRQLGVTARSVANWVRHPETEQTAAEAAPPATETNTFVPSRQRPTIHDVAARAGVSTSTVSNYLNQQGRMGEATGERVRAAIEALHFTPNFFVRAIRQRRTRILGLMTYGLSELDAPHSITGQIIQGVSEAAAAAEHEILLYTNWWQAEKHYTGLNFLNGHVDGLIWVAPRMNEPLLERVAAAGLPAVALLTRHVPAGVGYVNADNLGAMAQIVAHLAGRGHRHIAYVGPAHSSNYLDRRDGYRQAMTAAGPASFLHEATLTEDLWNWPLYEQILENWQERPGTPTAYINADDGFADLVGQWLARRGRRIPEDAAVTGFNDGPQAQTLCGGLTTIHQPFRAMARAGVERLIARIEGAPVEDCRLTIAADLIARASTGGPATPTVPISEGETPDGRRSRRGK